MKDELTDIEIATIVKLALEFNAQLIGLCTVYYGNMDSKNHKRFVGEYRKIADNYNSKVNKVIGYEKV